MVVDALVPFTAAEAAAFLGGQLVGSPGLTVARAVTATNLQPGSLAFLKSWARLGAGRQPDERVLLLAPAAEAPQPGWTVILVEEPRLAFARLLQEFFEEKRQPGIHPTAIVAPGATIDLSAQIGPYAVIGAGARIGPRTVLRNHVTIGRRVEIGSDCLVKSSSVIGEEGFGIVSDKDGNNLRLPHVGSVVIGHHVEIGALNTVCSGTVEPTRIGSYVKTDDHVHIGHNCVIGENGILTACAEFSGSVTLGQRVWVGPNACLMNGISVGDGAMIGLGAVVTKDVAEHVVVAGSPARFIRRT